MNMEFGNRRRNYLGDVSKIVGVGKDVIEAKQMRMEEAIVFVEDKEYMARINDWCERMERWISKEEGRVRTLEDDGDDLDVSRDMVEKMGIDLMLVFIRFCVSIENLRGSLGMMDRFVKQMKTKLGECGITRSLEFVRGVMKERRGEANWARFYYLNKREKIFFEYPFGDKKFLAVLSYKEKMQYFQNLFDRAFEIWVGLEFRSPSIGLRYAECEKLMAKVESYLEGLEGVKPRRQDVAEWVEWKIAQLMNNLNS